MNVVTIMHTLKVFMSVAASVLFTFFTVVKHSMACNNLIQMSCKHKHKNYYLLLLTVKVDHQTEAPHTLAKLIALTKGYL